MSFPALQGRDPNYFDPTIDRNRTQPKIALKRRASESTYDIRTPQTTHPLLRPRPAYHGAHFEKAPLQDEALGPLERTRGTISRSHSISPPIRRREITEPYERRPENFTRRMREDWECYKALSDTPDRANERLVKQAEAVDFEKDGIILLQGEVILAGVGAATVLREKANRAAQARSGFDQKYPQAQMTLGAVRGHEKQIRNIKNRARNFQKVTEELETKYKDWQALI